MGARGGIYGLSWATGKNHPENGYFWPIFTPFRSAAKPQETTLSPYLIPSIPIDPHQIPWYPITRHIYGVMRGISISARKLITLWRFEMVF